MSESEVPEDGDQQETPDSQADASGSELPEDRSQDEPANAQPDPNAASAESMPAAGVVPASNGSLIPATPAAVTYIYALGRVDARFPQLSVEREFAQMAARIDTAGATDREVFERVLAAPENRYLARQMCWVMTIEGLDTYILVPTDPVDFELLLGTLRTSPAPTDLDLVIGIKGPIASGDVCNGLTVPLVLFDQVYSFDRPSLVSELPAPEGSDSAAFADAATEVLDRVIRIADNAGGSDEHRALNYLAVRYPTIYQAAAQAFAGGAALAAVDVQPSTLPSVRNIVDVIFSFMNRATGVIEKQFVRVDVTEEFPFVITRLSPYFDI